MGLFDAIDQLHAGLDYHLARHNLLVANLSHVDTPGYKALDLQRAGTTSFSSSLASAMEVTDPRHLEGSATKEGWAVVEDPSAAAGSDGNGVSLDREAVKIAANQIRYDTLTSLVHDQLTGLEWAASDGK